MTAAAQAPYGIQIGDPVTLYWMDQEAFTYATITDVDNFGFEGSRPINCRRQWKNEGVTWVRGHHPPDSELCRAMAAARALVNDKAPSINATRLIPYGGMAGTGHIFAAPPRKHDIEI